METQAKKSLFNRFLTMVEVIGNKLPHPVTLFAIMAGIVIVLSAILSSLNVQVENPAEPGEVLQVKNLLSAEGINYMVSEMVNNFINFAPLGIVLATMLGIGVAERSGLISAALRGLVTSVPKRLITATLVFAGIMSSLAADAGYIVLPPLGALLFIAIGRHPLAGMAAAFAGVSGGFAANIFITASDPMLGELTRQAAATFDPAYAANINIAMNWYFLIASVFVITLAGTYVTEKIVEPRLGKYQADKTRDEAEEKISYLTKREKWALFYSGLAMFITIAVISLLVVPEWGPMRGDGDNPIIQSPFMNSLGILILFVFLIPGLVYGMIMRNIKSDKDVAHQLTDTMASMGMFIVLAFTAGQFVAFFNETNMGIVLGVYGAEFLESVNLTGIPLLLGFMGITMLINLFVGSASAKWAIMAPVFIPIMMQFNYSPEFIQLTYRVADSTTNVISPLMPYFAIIIAFAQKYDKKMGIGTLVSVMLPYAIVFTIVWTIMLFIWMALGIDIGPGSPIYYNN
ncbi:AbgT family transporter [Alkalihalobacillus pseudalcaliphilus]|uniref:AbgT family transporter n=1 Tax=Alkalihalobacillus pseudalcaliphilus TaxID=79884 RepID=UPI00064DB607|nr:AbgT family transporter [Alkalihalobacillus pseudalcaliphilus]KMK76378.1 aminobenzoyl-glutamate transporter [Alkalihalobacillus pseudalcaliphilus]